MQNYCKTIGALAAASALAAGNASAEVEYEIHVGYSTEYIFRGLNIGDDLVEAGVDVSTEWNGLGLSAGAWYGSFEQGTVNDSDELDLYTEVSKDLGFATVAVGYIYYHFLGNNPAGNEDTQEVYFSIAKDFFGVSTSLTYFWEVEDSGSGSNGYLEFAASKGFELSPCLVLNTGAALGYLVEPSEFAHLTAKVSLDWAFTETATLSPYLAHSWSLTNDADSAFWTNSENELFGGVSLAVSF